MVSTVANNAVSLHCHYKYFVPKYCNLLIEAHIQLPLPPKQSFGCFLVMRLQVFKTVNLFVDSYLEALYKIALQ